MSDSASQASKVHASLSAAKGARKLVEQDAQLLANRIALLKQEEEKAMKKILQTKQRAQEILRLRAENEARLAAKASTVEDLSATDSTRTSEAKPKETAAKKLEEQYRSRVAAVKELKAEKLAMRSELERQREEERLRARRLKEEVQRAKEEALKKKARAEALAAERRRQEYEARILAEEEARAATESKVQSLERIEMELIAKLKDTQLQQQKAFEELERALGEEGARG